MLKTSVLKSKKHYGKKLKDLKKEEIFYSWIIFLQIELKIQCNAIIIPGGIFPETDRLILKFTWNAKGSQGNLKEQSQS